MSGVRRAAAQRVADRRVTRRRSGVPSKPAAASKAVDSAELAPRSALSTALAGAVARLMPQPLEPLVGPPAGKPIKATGSLIGPGTELLDAAASFEQNLAILEQRGIPRFQWLTPIERQHETAFANDVEKNLEHFVAGVELIARDEALGTLVFEPDALKRLYGPYGTGHNPASSAERKVRAESNHALHPTATLLGRLAFLKRLDELARLPAKDARRTVFATSGGVSAGKGDMDEAVKLQFGGFPFGALWDSAGESDGLENAWVLRAVQARGLSVVFAYAANDAAPQFLRSLKRAARSGRYVDAVSFALSYVEGAKNMRAFLSSPEYLAAKAAGTAITLAMHMGPYDPRAEADPRLPHYPQARLLGDCGLIEARDVPKVPELEPLVVSAIATVEAEAKQLQAEGRDVEGLLTGALAVAEKFARSGVLERP